MLDLGLRNGEVVECSSRTSAETASTPIPRARCGNSPAARAVVRRVIALLKAIRQEQSEKKEGWERGYCQ